MRIAHSSEEYVDHFRGEAHGQNPERIVQQRAERGCSALRWTSASICFRWMTPPESDLHGGAVASEARRQIGEPGWGVLDEKGFEPLIAAGEDQYAQSEEKDSQRVLAPCARGEQPGA